MKLLKKLGWAAACTLPLIAMMAVQLLFAYAAAWFAPDVFNNAYPVIVVLADGVCTLLFALWFYRGLGRVRPAKPPFCATGRTLLVVVLMAAGLLLLVQVYMLALSFWQPAAMDDYNNIMEDSGLSSFTWLTLLATAVLAPVTEELAFRGLTLHFARRLCGRFWLANLIQALLFGIAHGNLIQGSYAFALGLVLGYFCHTYQSLGASMLLHACFNLFSAVFDLLFAQVPFTLLIALGELALGALCAGAAVRLLKRDPAVPAQASPLYHARKEPPL